MEVTTYCVSTWIIRICFRPTEFVTWIVSVNPTIDVIEKHRLLTSIGCNKNRIICRSWLPVMVGIVLPNSTRNKSTGITIPCMGVPRERINYLLTSWPPKRIAGSWIGRGCKHQITMTVVKGPRQSHCTLKMSFNKIDRVARRITAINGLVLAIEVFVHSRCKIVATTAIF